MPRKDQEEHNSEDFVSDFLRSLLEDSKKEEEEEKINYWSENNQFKRLSLSDYSRLYIPEAVENKITRLQKIANSIEAKVIQPTPGLQPVNQGKFKVDYWNSLNPGQYMAATTIKGPVLVIAGAGSGKTRTITYRVSYLIEKQVPPEEILLLTFTRKAAEEMMRRTTAILNNANATQVVRGTFHAFANHVLRRYASMIDLPTNFTIVDTSDSEDIIDLIRTETKVAKKNRAFPRKSRLQSIISKSRNCSIPIQDIIEREYTGLMEYLEEIKKIAAYYKKYKKVNQVLDYDDLMEVLRDCLRDYPHFRKRLQKRFQYIMVDEFQDTNIIQKEIVDYLAAGHRNVMVVGDDSQSIYAFRGANFENILTFPATYPDCRVIKLEQNYRSNQDILNFTNKIANNAKLGYRKQLFSTNTNLFKPLVYKFHDQEDEADFIGDKILALRENGIPLDEIAVLYRSSFHGNLIQTALSRRKIPYVVVGGIKFIERRHIKDIIAFLRIILNPMDAVAWNRILKLIPGIGKVTAGKIVGEIQANKGIMDFSKLEKRKYGANLLDLQKMFEDAVRPDITITSKIDIIRTYYEPLLKSLEDDYTKRVADIDILHRLSERYEILDRFLSDFALDPPSNQFQDSTTPLIDEQEEAPVTLSTIHSAKGLEWYTVFVPHLLDGLFPSARALKNIEDLEEERRLFYVACSRAKEQLYMTMPSWFSTWDEYFTQPSRFIIETGKDVFRLG